MPHPGERITDAALRLNILRRISAGVRRGPPEVDSSHQCAVTHPQPALRPTLIWNGTPHLELTEPISS
eukprot:3666393-Prymnesium_polylepis.1